VNYCATNSTGDRSAQTSPPHQNNARATPRPWMCRSANRLATTLAVAALLLTACSDSNNSGLNLTGIAQNHAVGITSRTFVDTSRGTAAHGTVNNPVPAAPTRTIATTIVYPAAGKPGSEVAADTPVEEADTPYPLVVLSHGLGGNTKLLLPLAEAWASRGYVVALPLFPLTNSATPGGARGEDVQNQPADVSFVIDEVLAESDSSGQLLSAAVDGERIAAITTYGLVANSCCRDIRIDAAIILSGALSPFVGGSYDLSDTPPMLVVQGVNDDLVSYNGAVRVYNQLEPLKGFLSLDEADHISYFIQGDAAFDVFTAATVDFLDVVLRNDTAALARMPEHEVPGVATMYWAPDDASNVPVEELPEPEVNRQASISADTDLVDGQVITVTWSGFLPDKIAHVMQCSGDGIGQATCNISGGKLFLDSINGMGSTQLVIRTGPIGNGVCDSTHPCQVLVNDNSLTEEEAIVRMPITLSD
jgi:predicted esterase